MVPRLLALTGKTLRLTTYLFVVTVVAGALVARVVYGRAKTSAIKIGDELLRLTGGGASPTFYRLRLNGELVSVSSATTPFSVKEVLGRFQKECETHADGIAEELARLSDFVKPGVAPVDKGWPGIGITRREESDRGFVACFAEGEKLSSREVIARLSEAFTSGDLGRIGNFRYVMARRTDHGSQIVAAWTNGSFNLNKMFPTDGDAPGNDPANAPRPAGARRTLTAFAEGAPYGMRVYEAPAGNPAIVLAQYDDQMPKHGWTAVPSVAKEMPNGRLYSRGGVDLVVSVTADGDRTMVSVVESGAH